MLRKQNRFLLLTVVFFMAIACSIPTIRWVGFNGKNEDVQRLADIGKYRANEPTPFRPFYYTPTPTRAVQPISNALVPNEGLVPPDGQTNILILGSDWRANSGYRTDIIVLVSINTKSGKVNLISFPRDLWVEIPNLQEERINTAMGYGGFPLLVETFKHNFAIPVDHYMMTNFYGFTSIIDTLGGIEIETDENTADRCDLSYEHGAWCSVGPGTAHLDGEIALWYVRSRYTSDDFDRTRRAQEVMAGLFKKLMSLDAVARAPELYTTFISSVETDLSLEDIIPLLGIAPKILADPSLVSHYYIGQSHVTPYVIPASGANVLLPNYNLIWGVIRKAVYTQ